MLRSGDVTLRFCQYLFVAVFQIQVMCVEVDCVRRFTSNAAVADPHQVVFCTLVPWHEVVYFWIDADLLTACEGEKKNRWKKGKSLLLYSSLRYGPAPTFKHQR